MIRHARHMLLLLTMLVVGIGCRVTRGGIAFEGFHSDRVLEDLGRVSSTDEGRE